MLTVNPARNTALDALLATHAALCTAFPGVGPGVANEVAGGSYARQAITFGAAASGIRTSTNAPAFPVPAATVAWIAFMTAISGGSMLAASPNNGNPKEFQMSSVLANGIYLPAHGYTAGTTQITFYGGTPPTGLVEGTTYVVCNDGSMTADAFKVAQVATPTVPIVISGTPGTACVVSIIVPEVFAAPGTFNLAIGATLNLNF